MADDLGGPGSGGRVLLVMRHAKAASPGGVVDHDRPLAARGRRDAPLVGGWLAEQGLVPDLVLCSDARRTRETAALVVEGTGADVDVRAVADLYDSGVEAVLTVVSDVPDDVRRLLVVGHEPTSSQVTAALTGSAPAFPTAAVAVVALAGGWAGIAAGAGSLRAFRTPGE